MNEKDLVTFEQAKKLKELGFNCETNYAYTKEEFDIYDRDVESIGKGELISKNSKFYIKAHCVDAPFLYQVQKWIYENHKLYVDAIHTAKEAFIICITNIYGSTKYISADSEWFTLPSEALSAGIDKALELL